jgi:hypothetical protein
MRVAQKYQYCLLYSEMELLKNIFNKDFIKYLYVNLLKGGVLNYLVLVPKSNNVFSMIPTTGKITKK